jgi:hypothetical protein
MELLKTKKLILDSNEIKNEKYVLIKCNKELYNKKYLKDLETGIETNTILKISTRIDEEILNYYLNYLITKDNDFDELVD